ncbi:MAG TPA: DUF3795 domain-containing protein [Dehalococcoidia bacterium]|nr:DUF3795 domain-containing protein [Dehalococcoidia bacterium]
MADANLAPVCGLYCGSCEYLGAQCRGCGHEQGKPFWTKGIDIEVCQLYDCCVNTKHLEHCGLCDDLPCEMFLSLRDPSLSDEEFEKSLMERQEVLEKRSLIGTEQWLQEKS